MKVVGCVKQVAMLGDEVEFTEDERDVDPDYLDFALNEWDSYATEEALRLVTDAIDRLGPQANIATSYAILCERGDKLHDGIAMVEKALAEGPLRGGIR